MNEDLVIQEFEIGSLHMKAAVLFVKGISDSKKIEQEILNPLLFRHDGGELSASFIKNQVYCLKSNTPKTIPQCVDLLNQGCAWLFISDEEQAFAFETSNLEHRSIDKPQSELALRGPNEAFVESLEVNKGLIRKHIKSEKLISIGFLQWNRNLNDVNFHWVLPGVHLNSRFILLL